MALLWRLLKARPDAEIAEESAAEKRALYIVAATSFLLAAFVAYETIGSLLSREERLTSPIGIVLSILSLAIMPALAYAKQRTAREMGSRTLVADSKEAWVCSYRSLALLVGVGLYAVAGGGGPTPSPPWPCSRHRLARLGNPHRHTPTRHRTRRGK